MLPWNVLEGVELGASTSSEDAWTLLDYSLFEMTKSTRIHAYTQSNQSPAQK